MNLESRINLIDNAINQSLLNLENRWSFSSMDESLNTTDKVRKVPKLIDAMRYATKSGKRIRPLLLLLCFEQSKGYDENLSLDEFYANHPEVLTYATALEFIHAYSLVHDDLPCMDDDDMRRGEPTVHKKFGESTAVLAGDALLNFAYELIFESLADSSNQEYSLKAARYFSQNAGLQGMIGGQVYDLDSCFLDSTANVQLMVEKKTCALIRIAAVVGATLAGANDENIYKIDKFAYHLGLAYQAKDDVFDIVEDRIEEKTTLITYMDSHEANRYVETQTQSAQLAVKGLNNHNNLLEFANKLMIRNY